MKIAFRRGIHRSSTGDLHLYTALPEGGDGRPVVVFIPGTFRQPDYLVHWAAPLKDIADVVLVDLPGHGRSDPLLPASVETLARKIHDALTVGLVGRRVLVVGESLGGLIALAMGGPIGEGGPVRAVLAADPPLTMAKQWAVVENLRRALARTEEGTIVSKMPADFVRSMALEVFGVSASELKERIYFPLIETLRVPATIITGDLQPWPPRAESGRPGQTVCVMDEADGFILSKFYGNKVAFHQIANCGHLVLHDAVDASLEHISTMLEAHVGVPASVG